MTEVRRFEEKRFVNGKMEAGEFTRTTIVDSSDRVARVTQSHDGPTHTWVNDWMAATFTSWSSDEPRARRIHLPMAQAGRVTCWRAYYTNRQGYREPFDAQCLAYDPKNPPTSPQQYCQTPSDSQLQLAPDSDFGKPGTDESQFHWCSSDWKGPEATIENLHTKETVFGTIWGCRMSKITLGQKITEEKWIDKHEFTVIDDIDNRLTSRHTTETLLSLKFEDPDPAQFAPPKDYEIEDLQMEEAPCPPPLNQ
jgi:hypothetical protein